jgi:hypothetical protein
MDNGLVRNTSMMTANSQRLTRRFLSQVIHVVHHGNKQVEEQLAAVLHLLLHCATAFECVSRANDQSQIMGPQLGVVIGCVGVGKPGRGENRTALNTRLKSLFPQSKFLQLL